MMTLCSDVLVCLKERTLATAESCTGGGIGAAITAVPGASAVYKGGVICYSNWVKEHCLDVPADMLLKCGAVSEQVAIKMAVGVRKHLQADVAVSVTGLAGPGGDEYGNPVGTVWIGYADQQKSMAKKFAFKGERDEIRNQAIRSALELILEVSQ